MLSSMTFEELLQRVPDEAARRYLLTAVRSDIATEPNSTNALNGIKNVLMDNPRYLKLYAIAGGLEQLIAKLAASLRAKILLRHRVNAISRSGRELCRARGRKALPLRCRGPRATRLLSETASSSKTGICVARSVRTASHYDRPGHYLRVTALFRTPFWRRKVPGNYFMIDAFGGACVYDESSRFDARGKGVLSWLLAGQDAMMLSSQDDNSLCRKMIQCVAGPAPGSGCARVQGRHGPPLDRRNQRAARWGSAKRSAVAASAGAAPPPQHSRGGRLPV